MKKIQIRVSGLATALLSGVITLMGFGSCRSSQQSGTAATPATPAADISQMKLMYGVPQNVYRISGTVTGPDKKPVEGAEVIITRCNIDGEVVTDTLKTDYNGVYFTPYLRPGGSDRVEIEVRAPRMRTEKKEVSMMQAVKDRSKRYDFRLKEDK